MAIHRYLALAEERETICCFLDFHEISEEPRKIQKLEIERRVSGQAAQSESAKALSLTVEEEEKNKPWPGVRLMYYKIFMAARR